MNEQMLDNFHEMVKDLKTLREDQVLSLLRLECSTRKRPAFIERLHMRFNKLRCARERAELLEGGLL